MNKKYLSALAFVITLAGVGAAANVNAQANPAPNQQYGGMGGGMSHKGSGMGRGMMKPAAFGTVTAINGSTLTVNSTDQKTSVVTTYTVDATNAKITKNRVTGTVSSIAIGDNVAVMGTENGTNITATAVMDGVMMGGQGMGQGMMHNGVFGTVASISGNTITLTSKQFQPKGSANSTTAGATVTYTVDATNATVTKSGATSSVGAIAVGDTLMVQGTVTGTSVAATKINDGVMPGGAGMPNVPAGNGQPIIGGTVSAVSGSTITITNTSGTAYTIDATNAKVSKIGLATPTVANINVGDIVLAQGTINGTSVVANSVIDNGTAPTNPNQQVAGGSQNQSNPGILSKIGGFFKHMFGFF